MDSDDALHAVRLLQKEKREISPEERAMIDADLKRLEDELAALVAEKFKDRKPVKPVEDPFQIEKQ